MRTKKELLNSYNHISKLNDELITELGKLGSIASDILGYEVVADLCNGNEIEFRKMMPDGRPDHKDSIRIEGILNKTK